jgi:hypothetical protein
MLGVFMREEIYFSVHMLEIRPATAILDAMALAMQPRVCS